MQNQIMIDVGNFARRIVTPSRYRFPDAAKSGCVPPTWEWHNMADLHCAVQEIYGSQGYDKFSHRHHGMPYPDYASFALFWKMCWRDIGGHNEPFTALRYRENLGNNSLIIDPDPSDLSGLFERSTENLYVPAVWGDEVIVIAKLGIIAIKCANDGSVETTNWKREKLSITKNALATHFRG